MLEPLRPTCRPWSANERRATDHRGQHRHLATRSRSGLSGIVAGRRSVARPQMGQDGVSGRRVRVRHREDRRDLVYDLVEPALLVLCRLLVPDRHSGEKSRLLRCEHVEHVLLPAPPPQRPGRHVDVPRDILRVPRNRKFRRRFGLVRLLVVAHEPDDVFRFWLLDLRHVHILHPSWVAAGHLFCGPLNSVSTLMDLVRSSVVIVAWPRLANHSPGPFHSIIRLQLSRVISFCHGSFKRTPAAAAMRLKLSSSSGRTVPDPSTPSSSSGFSNHAERKASPLSLSDTTPK